MGSTDFVSYLHLKKTPDWFPFFLTFLKLYPPFNYSKIFTDISQKSGFHYEVANVSWERGDGFKWEDMGVGKTGTMFNGEEYYRNPPIYNLILLFLNGLSYLILAYYFDNVVSSNRGIGKNKLFFIPYLEFFKKKFLPSLKIE